MKTTALPMKLTILFVLFMNAIAFKASAQFYSYPEYYGNYTQQLQSIYNSRWDVGTKAWIPNDTTEVLYNAKGQWTHKNRVMYDKNTATWKKDWIEMNAFNAKDQLIIELDSVLTAPSINSRTLYTYNADGKVIESKVFDYDVVELKWIEYTKTAFYYNQDKLLDSSELSEYDAVSKTWTPYSKEKYEYNSDKRIERKIKSFWNKSGSVFKFYDREIFVYNPIGQTISKTGQVWAVTNEWKNKDKQETDYNTENQETQNRFYNWDLVNNNWKIRVNTNTVYTTSPAKIESIRVYYGNDPAGEFEDRVERYLDDSGRQQLSIEYGWDAVGKKWVGEWVYDELFDNNGYITRELVQKYDAVGKNYVNFAQYKFRWQAAKNLSVENDVNAFSATVYPNPCQEYCTIRIPENEKASRILFTDLQGRVVQELNGHFTGDWKLNMEQLQGTYLVQVYTENAVYNATVIVN